MKGLWNLKTTWIHKPTLGGSVWQLIVVGGLIGVVIKPFFKKNPGWAEFERVKVSVALTIL
jgi:hypothetical protein